MVSISLFEDKSNSLLLMGTPGPCKTFPSSPSPLPLPSASSLSSLGVKQHERTGTKPEKDKVGGTAYINFILTTSHGRKIELTRVRHRNLRPENK